MNTEIIVKKVRLSFSQNLIEAKASKGGDKPRYSANFIIDMSTEEGRKTKAQVDKVIEEILAEEFKGRELVGKDVCLRKGDTQIDKKTDEVYKGYAGNFFISGARSEKRGAPLVTGYKTSAGAVARNHDEFPESGDWVNAKLNIYSLNGKNDKGGDPSHGRKICCEIQVVQLAAKGEPLGGGGKPTTAGLDDIDEVDVDDLG